MVAGMMIFGFAMSSSLDNLGVGISYGIRGVRINFLSNLLIAVICFALSMVGILSGQWLAQVLPGIIPVLIGALLLIIVGIRMMLLTTPSKAAQQQAPLTEHPAPSNRRSRLSLLTNPASAHANAAGTIGLGEAIILGVALAANAVTNGVGAGLLGLSPLAISLTAAIGSYISVWLGVAIGHKAAGIRIGRYTLGQFSTVLSGLLIVLIAINTLFD